MKKTIYKLLKNFIEKNDATKDNNIFAYVHKDFLKDKINAQL